MIVIVIVIVIGPKRRESCNWDRVYKHITYTWKILTTTYEQKRLLSNPDPGENLVSGNLVTETGCKQQPAKDKRACETLRTITSTLTQEAADVNASDERRESLWWRPGVWRRLDGGEAPYQIQRTWEFPPLRIKSLLGSNPPISKLLVGGLGVLWRRLDIVITRNLM